MARLSIGDKQACKYCGQDIEWNGRALGWTDRGGNRSCCSYVDKSKGAIVKPKTKHKANSYAI